MSEFTTSNLLFRVYLHGKGKGYVTIPINRLSTLVALKQTALDRFALLANKQSPVLPDARSENVTTPVEAHRNPDGSLKTAQDYHNQQQQQQQPPQQPETKEDGSTNDTVKVVQELEETDPDTTTTTTATTTTNTAVDDPDPVHPDFQADMYFVRLLSDPQTNLFQDAIQRCHSDDEALYKETKQWITGQEDKTLVYSIHDLWQEKMDERAQELVKHKVSRRRSFFGRANTSPAPKPKDHKKSPSLSTTVEEDTATESNHTTTKNNEKLALPGTATAKLRSSSASASSASSASSVNHVAMLELVPLDIIPPNSTTM
jgi:hypothetical protein